MSRTKEEYFDEINIGFEKARLIKYLAKYPLKSDFSPILVAKEAYKEFRLTKEEIAKVIREYYNF